MNLERLEAEIRRAKRRLLQMHYESGVGHIGGNLSCLDALMTLHHAIMAPDDTFVLSKGHAAGALYITLWSLGKLTDDDLRTFHKDGTKLSGHPAPNWRRDIPFATGSLGHGLSLAAGMALANRLQKKAGQIYCLTSDGEWQEGSNWEALIFAQHQKLTNLTLIVDVNGLQGFGRTADVGNLEPFAEKFRAFGLSVLEIDGHDASELQDALNGKDTETNSSLRVILARTRKGCGVSFMENCMDWHYLPMTEAQYGQAQNEIGATAVISERGGLCATR